ncbi:MAG: hypothetical protein ACLGRW_05045 [Acidobacteriota bacterium]
MDIELPFAAVSCFHSDALALYRLIKQFEKAGKDRSGKSQLPMESF